MASRARKRKSSSKRRKRKSAAAARTRKSSVAVRKRKSSAATRKRKRVAGARKRKSVAGVRKRKRVTKTAKRKRVAKTARRKRRATRAADPVVEKLKQLIADDKIIFDADRHRKSLLGLSTGINATRKLQALVLALSELAGQQMRISSVVRAGGGSHHGPGRAVDIGNEEIARTLLPRVATDAQVAALGIDELIFDATVAGRSDPNEWNYDRGRKHDYGPATLREHRNHIHFAVKA